MKAMKCIVVLALALVAFAGVSNAQTIQFLGGGSSALFVELGQAAVVAEGGVGVACVWSSGKLADGNVAAIDNRVPDTQLGNVWVVWDKGTGADCQHPAGNFNVYTYLSVDSVIGNRCFFDAEAGQGCQAVYTPTQAEGNAAGNQLTAAFPDSASNATCSGTQQPCIIPTTVTAVLNGQHWFAAGTDVRPEDAKFATFRALTPCTTGIFRAPFGGGLTSTSGLGYNVGGPKAGVGVPIQSFYSTALFTVADFNITGTDPLNGNAVRGYTVNTVGAQPIIVAVTSNVANTLLQATDINRFTLALFYNGVLGRAKDLIGPTANAAGLTEILVREPLSGTYNTFEFSIPNTNEFHTSQELGNCNGGTGAPSANPMNLQSGNGIPLTARRRVLGTGEMVNTLANFVSNVCNALTDDRLGYFFWSAGNASRFGTCNGASAKYLTVDGVDPLQNSYTGGTIPTTAAQLANVTFKNLNAGDYPVWSALRIVTTNPAPAGVLNLIANAQTLSSTQNDFIPVTRLATWHSHFALPQVSVGAAANGTSINTPNDLCASAGALVELGGDAGGANVLKQANLDFCADFSNVTGLINASN